VAAELTAAGKVIVELSIGQLTQFAGNMLEVKKPQRTSLHGYVCRGAGFAHE